MTNHPVKHHHHHKHGHRHHEHHSEYHHLYRHPKYPHLPAKYHYYISKYGVKDGDSSDQAPQLKITIEEAAQKLQAASQTLLSTYRVDNDDSDFNSLRSDITKSCLVYKNKIYPFADVVVLNISGQFEVYQDLSFDDWSSDLDDMIDMATQYKDQADFVAQLHTTLLTELKAEMTAGINLENKLQDAINSMEAKKEKWEAEYNAENRWAGYLACVPNIVTEVVATILKIIAAHIKELADQIAKEERLAAATKSVTDTLLTGLSQFIDAVGFFASFFAILEADLKKYAANNITAARAHFTVMKAEAKGILASCDSFLGISPQVKSDMDAIPGYDQYQDAIHVWLKNQKADNGQTYYDWGKVLFKDNKDVQKVLDS